LNNSTSTIAQNVNSWSLATSTSAVPILSVDGSNSRVGIGLANPSVALQVVGDYVRIGDGGSVGSADGDGDLYIEDELEVDGVFYFGYGYLLGDNPLFFGSNGLASIFWESADNDARTVFLELPEGSANDVPVFTIGDDSMVNLNLGFFDGVTDPSIAILSDDASEYTRLYTEDDGDFVIKTGTTTVPNLILDTNKVGIGTSSPASLTDFYSTATTTITIDSNAASQGSCLKLKDVDGDGYTYCYVNNGVMTCSTTSCE
jgi:hypothetical protein